LAGNVRNAVPSLDDQKNPPGGSFGIVKGTVRCAGCKKAVSAADVYAGKHDVSPLYVLARKVFPRGGVIGRISAFFKRLFSHKTRCWECYWYANAMLDGKRHKGICNFGTGQAPPFIMSPGDRVKIAFGYEVSCKHFHPVLRGPPPKRKVSTRKKSSKPGTSTRNSGKKNP